jgi:hypothetical protein
MAALRCVAMRFLRGRSTERWARAMATVVTAEETRTSVTLGPEGRVGSTQVVWRVRVRFEPAGQPVVDTEQRLAMSQGVHPYPGQVLPIRYDPRDPRRFELDESAAATVDLVTHQVGNPEVAGMPLDEYLRLGMSDPEALQARTAAWAQAQQAAADAQIAALQQQAAALHAEALAQPAAPSGLAAQVAELAALHAAGVLTDEEFAAAKHRLLAG